MATATYVPEGAGATETLPLPSKLHGWIVTVNHKRLGTLYIATALFFFAVAGLLAALIRLQLAIPGGKFLTPDVFQPVVHDAWNQDGVSDWHAVFYRARKLPRAPYDRRARYGISAIECFWILDLPLRRNPALL
jgi:hypothetical protein